jgi:hypothetical protein
VLLHHGFPRRSTKRGKYPLVALTTKQVYLSVTLDSETEDGDSASEDLLPSKRIQQPLLLSNDERLSLSL